MRGRMIRVPIYYTLDIVLLLVAASFYGLTCPANCARSRNLLCKISVYSCGCLAVPDSVFVSARENTDCPMKISPSYDLWQLKAVSIHNHS